MLAEKKRGIRSSGPLFMFWFLLTLCGGFTYADRIKSIVDGVGMASFCSLLRVINLVMFYTDGQFGGISVCLGNGLLSICCCNVVYQLLR